MNKKKWRDPHLEELRKTVLKEAVANQKSLEEIADEMSVALNRVHASFLFAPEYEEALKTICIVLSAPSGGILGNSWNALAVELGFTYYQVECIKNMNHADPTHLVLMSYATRLDAVLGTVIAILKKIKRLDVFTAARKYLEDIVTKYDTTNEDSGFSSMESSSDVQPIQIIYPPGFSNIQALLDAPLFITIKQPKQETKIQKVPAIKSGDVRNRHKEENRLQGSEASAIPKTPKITPKCNVFLTFARDGAELARDIARTFRTPSGKRPIIGVLLLEQQREKVLPNPEQFIMHYFHKMNYIVPILTEGYMTAIGTPVVGEGSSLENLDNKYVQYIHDLCNKYYLENSCRNKKIRCVIPIDRRSILNHTHRKLDPIMKAYVYDTEIEELAKRMTGTFEEDGNTYKPPLLKMKA